MTVAVNLADRGGYFMRVSALAATSPALFLFLTETTELQPLLDPKAGYGAYHVVKTFFDLDMDEAQRGKFLIACDHSALIGYIILRACEYRYFDMRTFTAQLEAGCFEVQAALDHMRKFLPDFGMADGRHRLEAAVTSYEDNHGDQEAASRT